MLLDSKNLYNYNIFFFLKYSLIVKNMLAAVIFKYKVNFINVIINLIIEKSEQKYNGVKHYTIMY